MSAERYFQAFWNQYIKEIPAAKHIHQLFVDRNEKVDCLDHDHLALRTFNDPRVNLDVIIKPFVEAGYQPSMTYDFPVKHLFARHYEPPKPGLPKIFISHLLLEKFSPALQKTVQGFLSKIPEDLLKQEDKLFISETPWGVPDFDVYQSLLKESQYAAWMYAFGFRANHFAVHVNTLKSFHSCEEINAFLKMQGYTINTLNGEVKGSKAQLLEQSSIMAAVKTVTFQDGPHDIPACYYEFTKRYPDKDGTLYPGFIAASADKIFQSTDVFQDADKKDLEMF